MNGKIPRSEHPRPQFQRADWVNLNGVWTYEFDFGQSGLERGLEKSSGFSNNILVPYCPESRLSGVAHVDFINQMFYHRTVRVPDAWAGRRVILHFGAVDYECEVFVDGKRLGIHYGGSVSFEFDATDFLTPGADHDLVLRVHDDVRSGLQASGKQCRGYYSAGCAYTRVTGIWQTVWMEAVADHGLASCRMVPNFDGKAFSFQPVFRRGADGKNLFRVTVSGPGAEPVGATVAAADGFPVTVQLGENARAWSSADPYLYDVTLEVLDASGRAIDRVSTYAGLRKIAVEGDRVMLNNQPVFLRFVLDQGYYPEGIWTASDDADLKRDIELSLAAGFNGARLHQKVFEERFHYWADKLGYLTWGESASWGCSFLTSADSASLVCARSFGFFTAEWREIVERDANHPSIIAWTPANETWPRDLVEYRRLMCSIYDLTKSIDPTRPVNDASGYAHAKTDLWTVHFYCKTVEDLKNCMEPEDRPVAIRDTDDGYHGQPYIADEIGGFMYIPPDRKKFAENTWGYHGMSLKNGDELCELIAGQVRYLAGNPKVSGYCYTQLTDVEQEQNGIYNYDRTEKVAPEKLAAAFNAKN